eukprot:scaffold27622_cov19-Tisochrysis_lutea.AAC.3
MSGVPCEDCEDGFDAATPCSSGAPSAVGTGLCSLLSTILGVELAVHCVRSMISNWLTSTLSPVPVLLLPHPGITSCQHKYLFGAV